MGRRGPRPEPTQIKIARGNPGKRKLNTKEPKPSNARPRRPLALSKLADACWKSLIPKLDKLGVLTQTDSDMLVLYCETWGRWREARDWIKKHGAKYPVMGEDGRPKFWKPWPEIQIEIASRFTLIRLASEFGMTPSSRTQIVGSEKEDRDELLAFLDQNPARKRA